VLDIYKANHSSYPPSPMYRKDPHHIVSKTAWSIVAWSQSAHLYKQTKEVIIRI